MVLVMVENMFSPVIHQKVLEDLLIIPDLALRVYGQFPQLQDQENIKNHLNLESMEIKNYIKLCPILNLPRYDQMQTISNFLQF